MAFRINKVLILVSGEIRVGLIIFDIYTDNIIICIHIYAFNIFFSRIDKN